MCSWRMKISSSSNMSRLLSAGSTQEILGATIAHTGRVGKQSCLLLELKGNIFHPLLPQEFGVIHKVIPVAWIY